MFDMRKKRMIKEAALAIFGPDADVEVSAYAASIWLRGESEIFGDIDSVSVEITNFDEGKYGLTMHPEREFAVGQLEAMVALIRRLEGPEDGGDDAQKGGK